MCVYVVVGRGGLGTKLFHISVVSHLLIPKCLPNRSKTGWKRTFPLGAFHQQKGSERKCSRGWRRGIRPIERVCSYKIEAASQSRTSRVKRFVKLNKALINWIVTEWRDWIASIMPLCAASKARSFGRHPLGR
jgi:hypothetical protein